MSAFLDFLPGSRPPVTPIEHAEPHLAQAHVPCWGCPMTPDQVPDEIVDAAERANECSSDDYDCRCPDEEQLRRALAAVWPLIVEEIGKALPAVLNLQGVWDSSVPPGGFVCPLCGEPWEDEPSCQHAKDVAWYDAQVRAGALKRAADDLDVERDYPLGSTAQDAAAEWLRARAAAQTTQTPEETT